MATNYISQQDITVKGNIDQTAANEGPVTITAVLNFSNAQVFIFDPTIVTQGMLYTTTKSLFVDNSTNPKPIFVTVDTSGQYFPIPPFSSGWYKISANQDSKITLTSDGGATRRTPVLFTNYEQEPIVWFGFAPLIDGAKVQVIGVDGITIDGITNPFIVGGWDGTTARTLKTDVTGKLEVVGTSGGGVAFGPDNAGILPTQNPVQLSGVDGGGLVRRVVTDTTGRAVVTGAAAAGTAAAGNPNLIGGRASTALPTAVAAGQIANTWVGPTGQLIVGGVSAGGYGALLSPQGFVDSGGVTRPLAIAPYFSDGVNTNINPTITALPTTGVGVQAVGCVGRGSSALPTAVVSGEYTRNWLSLNGATMIAAGPGGSAPNASFSSMNALTDSSGTTRPLAIANFVWDTTNLVAQRGDNEGTFAKEVRATTATVTTNVLAGASVTVLASLASRKSWSVYNDGAVTVYLRRGAAAASATDFSLPLIAGAYYECDNYSGEVRAFGASGTLRVTSNV